MRRIEQHSRSRANGGASTILDVARRIPGGCIDERIIIDLARRIPGGCIDERIIIDLARRTVGR